MSSEKLTIKEFREILPDIDEERLGFLFAFFQYMSEEDCRELWDIVKDFHDNKIIGINKENEGN